MTSCPRRFIHLSLDFFWGATAIQVCQAILFVKHCWDLLGIDLTFWLSSMMRSTVLFFPPENYQFFGLQDLANDKPLWKKTEGDVWIYANKWRGSNRFLDRGKRGWTTKYSQYSISIAKILPVDVDLMYVKVLWFPSESARGHPSNCQVFGWNWMPNKKICPPKCSICHCLTCKGTCEASRSQKN